MPPGRPEGSGRGRGRPGPLRPRDVLLLPWGRIAPPTDASWGSENPAPLAGVPCSFPLITRNRKPWFSSSLRRMLLQPQHSALGGWGRRRRGTALITGPPQGSPWVTNTPCLYVSSRALMERFKTLTEFLYVNPMARRELPFISTHPSHSTTSFLRSSVPVCCNCLRIHGGQ